MSNTPAIKQEEIFNELFDTFLGDGSLDECLRKAEWLTGNFEELPTQLNMSTGTHLGKRKITDVKLEPNQIRSQIPRYCGPVGSPGRPLLTRASRQEEEEQWNLEEDHGGYDLSLIHNLSKNEERALKKMRRKIKNKISAQESRRKKKEYVEGLERRVGMFSSVNEDLQQRLSELEAINKAMQEKIILFTTKKEIRSTSTQT